MGTHGVLGIDSGYDEKPPADSGLRLDSKTRYWMPSLRSVKGREWADRLAALTLWVPRNHFEEVGIPSMIFTDHRVYQSGISFDEEPEPTLYQTWGSGRCAEDCRATAKDVPEVEWVEVPRSVWYAREEAMAAALV